MVNFALVQLSKKHTEIFGTFIEIIMLKFKWNLTIYYNLDLDNYTFIPYYQKLFNIHINVLPTSELKNDKSIYDFIIFTSSADKIDDYLKKNNKCIYINHQAAHWKDYMKKNIIVSPLIHSLELDHTNVEYILPIYKSYKKFHANINVNNFAIVGAIRLNNQDKEIKLLLDLLNKYKGNYEIHIFMRHNDWKNISNKYKILKNHPKIKNFSGLRTEDLMERLKNIKFILPLTKKGGWFHWQRLTGSLPLAFNLNMPMIMDRKLASIYGVEHCGICYEDSLLEVMDKVCNISNDEYIKLVENIVLYKKDIYKQNIDHFLKICMKSVEKID